MGDYSGQPRQRAGTASQERLNAPLPLGGSRPMRPGGSYENMRQPSSIRIRRLPPQTPSGSRPTSQAGESDGVAAIDAAVTGRRRSSSAPQRYEQNLTVPGGVDLSRQRTADAATHMNTITEGSVADQSTPYFEAAETPRPRMPSSLIPDDGYGSGPVSRVATNVSAMNSAGNAALRNRGLRRLRSHAGGDRSDYHNRHDEYDSDVVDLLDLLDPEVRTLGTLTNVQNSLFVPDLGGFINRRPTYELRARPGDVETPYQRTERPFSRAGNRTYTAQPPMTRKPTAQQPGSQDSDIELQPRHQRTMSISSRLSDSRFAVLPHG
ncbi:hypothetical protein LTR53_016644, partial [Teratosphaeriaceae sp. CCFEE 6253]